MSVSLCRLALRVVWGTEETGVQCVGGGFAQITSLAPSCLD